MVLGLGSRSKKDRASASAVSQLVDLDLQLHEIKPWQGHHRSSKAPVSVILRWSRGEKPIGSSRSISPTVSSGTEGGKIVLGEAFCISIAPNRDVLKRAKKTSPDLDRPLVFSLLETSSLKGQPLAQAALDLAAFASLPDSKTIAIPLTVSKKISSKGSISYLHLTVGHHQDDIHSGAAAAEGRFPVSASAANSASSRTSDASSVPPLDEDSQQALVAALLSEEEEEGDDKDVEIAPFTDDEDDDHGDDPVPQGSHPPQGNVNVAAVASVFQSVVEKPTNKPIQQIVEKQPEKADDRISRHVLSSPKASPVKAAAIVAATAYATKHSFLTRGTNSFMDESYDLYSDPDSAGEDDFSTHVSLGARSPNLLAKGPQMGGRSFHTSLSRSGAESVSSAAVDKSTKAAGEKAVVETKGTTKTSSLAGKDLHEGANTNDVVGKKAVISDRYSKLSSEHFSLYGTHAGNSSSMNLAKTPSNSAMSNLVDRKTPVAGMVGALGEKVGLPSINSITTTANSSTLNSTKESNSKSLEASLEPKTVLERDIDNEKMLDKVSNSNPGVEIGEVQVGSMVESGIVAEDKYQRKTLVEMKAKVAVKSSLKEKDAVEPPKMRASKSPDQMKGRISESLGQNLKSSKSANQEGEARAFKSPERDGENVDKKATEEAKPKVALAEAKAAVAETRVQNLEVEVEKLKGELRDVAAVEAALYSTTAEHGSSSLKLHAPARRLARMYVYACNHWSEERRASCARNTVAGLILVARACGNDVPRLTFWWSNAAVLREIISTAFNVLPASPKVDTASHTDLRAERADFSSFPKETKLRQQQQVASPVLNFEDWRQPSTFTSSLERLEGWIYTKVVESIWWQVLTPQMQQPMDDTSSEIDLSDVDVNLDDVKNERKSFGLELEDARQGSISVEIWKKAFLDAYERLCPVRRLGVECGCLPMLNKMVLETCIVRLDVAMFNAILRDDEAPTDPISDPISDTRVLPIPTSSLSFGLGAQLKNAVTTLSSWLSNLMSKDGDSVMNGSIPEDDEKSLVMFPLLKAMGGLLMLPKAMLIEKSFRIEVCPTLSLPFIERILSRFKPDELSTEPVTPELLEAINSEVAAESQLQGDMDDSVTTLRSAFAPSVIYSCPQSSMVRHWIGDTASSNSRFGRSNSSVLRKGHTSDDEIDELESPISWLLENTIGLTAGSLDRPSMGQKDDSHANGKATNTFKETGTNCRFQLLREVWNSG